MREEKELFVASNVLGGSPWEVLSLFVGVAVVAGAAGRMEGPVQVIALVIPLCLLCTVGAGVAPWIAWIAAAGMMTVVPGLEPRGQSRELGVTTVYRGVMMLFTCVCILAVDFPIFPRRFGKTEEFGFSLMDAGVGMFVFSSGMFAKGERGISTSWVVVALGIVRLVVTWWFDYHQHITEYGSHWNFFMTLGVVHIMCLGVFQAHRWPASLVGLAAVAICVVYQVALSSTGLTEFLLHSQRTTLFTHNREGIVSSVGFISIFLFGVSLKKNLDSSLALKLIFFAFGVAAALTHALWQEVSRRMANLGYVCFIISANALILWMLQCMHVRAGPVLRGISRFQLPIFLLANVATGAVNLSMNTITASGAVALFVLITYSTLISSVAIFLDRRQVQK